MCVFIKHDMVLLNTTKKKKFIIDFSGNQRKSALNTKLAFSQFSNSADTAYFLGAADGH